MQIRAATIDELPVLQDIERAAGRLFAELGMTAVAEDEPLDIIALEHFRDDGYAWVVADPTPVAYLVAAPLDGNLHIEQVSVHPDHARRRLGAALIDAADTAGWPASTLTTFRDVPFNAPYYRRLGFRDVPEDQETPGLRAIRKAEVAHGLDRWPRLCMRRPNRRAVPADGG